MMTLFLFFLPGRIKLIKLQMMLLPALEATH